MCTCEKMSPTSLFSSYLAHEDVQQRLQVFIVTDVAAEGGQGLTAGVHNLQHGVGRFESIKWLVVTWVWVVQERGYKGL